MTTLRTVRLTIAACLSLWPTTPLAAASVLQAARQDAPGTLLTEDQVALLNKTVSSANFTLTDLGLFQVATAQLQAHLSEEGFRNTFNTNMVSYTISGWYSPALHRSIICIQEQSDNGYQHLAYSVEGRVRQHDSVMY